MSRERMRQPAHPFADVHSLPYDDYAGPHTYARTLWDLLVGLQRVRTPGYERFLESPAVTWEAIARHLLDALSRRVPDVWDWVPAGAPQAISLREWRVIEHVRRTP